MKCPKCGSERIQMTVSQERKKHGCLWWCFFGIFGFLAKKQNVSVCICQDCGHNWKIQQPK